MQILIVTGISGSGKSVVLNVLEDAGYYCVDNLPAHMLTGLVLALEAAQRTRIAVSCDIRGGPTLHELPIHVEQLKKRGHQVKVLFLTASTHCLVQRYSETRRRHPLNSTPEQASATLIECIEEERELVEASIGHIGHVLDTSELKPAVLRQWTQDFLGVESRGLLVMFESFAFKHGVPLDADLVFDVRCLPNPYYETALRPLTGRDRPVQEYLKNIEDVGRLIEDIRSFVARWLPAYTRDHRSYLTVAIGCTGGQHRSVFCVEQLAALFRKEQNVLVRHRALPKDTPA